MDVVSFLPMGDRRQDAEDSDLRFLRYARQGDVAELDSLLAEHLDQSYCQARRLLGNPNEAEDAVHEAFLRLIRSAHRYDGSVPFGAWLGCMVHRASLNALRSRKRRSRNEKQARLQPANAPEHETFPTADELEAVRAAVVELPDRYRAPINLHYFAGLSQRDIGKALGMKEDAVAKRMQRARDCLRALLQRRGVTVTAALAITALSSAQSYAAPASLSAKTTSAALSAHAANGVSASFATPVVGSLFAKHLAIALTALAMAAAGAWWTITPSTSPSTARFSFDRIEEIKHLPVIEGTFTWLPDQGLGGSGCMETGTGTVKIALPIDRRRLPVLITFKICLNEPANGHGYHVDYEHDRWIAWFNHAGAIVDFDLDHPHWVENETYLTESYFCNFADRQLGSISFSKPLSANENIVLIVTNRFRLDDVEIRPIGPDRLPDVARFIDALDGIPEAQRHGEVVVPGLTSPTPGQQVTISFTGNPP